MRRVFFLLVFICLISPPSLHGIAQDESGLPSPDSAAAAKLQEQLGVEEFDAETVVAANSFVASTGMVDWLGPMSPIAMSPFFGITCLSGLSLYGPEWMADNQLIRSAGPIKHHWFFGLFLVLTVLTSLPRLTKVSKPFAQAVDRLEAYAVIVILLVIKIGSSMASPGAESVQLVQLGVFDVTLDTLLAVAMVINVLVVNSVKFFFEFLVWLTPVPLLDAVFEICNKTLCAALMAVYVISPTLATVINLCMLVFAAILFRWISRRVRFYRTMILDPVVARLWASYARPRHPQLIVFPKEQIGPFKPKSRLKLTRQTEDGGWILDEASWWRPAKRFELSPDCQPELHQGWVMNAIRMNQDGDNELTFSRRYGAEALTSLAEQLGITMSQPEHESDGITHEKVAHEFG